AVALGADALKWRGDKPGKVHLIDGEQSHTDLHEKLLKVCESLSIDNVDDYKDKLACNLKIAALSLQHRQSHNLHDIADESTLKDLHIEPGSVVIFDNLNSLTNVPDGMDEQTHWQALQRLTFPLKKKGCAIVFVHHANKEGGQHGTSLKERPMDVIIRLES